MTVRDELGLALDTLEFEQALEVIGVLARVNPGVVTLPAVQEWSNHNCTKIAWLAFNDKMPPSPFFVKRYHQALNEIADYSYAAAESEPAQACENMRAVARKALGKV